MKFILNEDISQKFILTEADTEITLEFDDSVDSGVIDWDARLVAAREGKSAETPQEVWDKYYAEEWGTDAQKVKTLGPGFKQEVEEYGFSEINNPFIKFLKTTSPKVLDFNWSAAKYGTLHNAVVDKDVTKEELLNPNNTTNYLSLVYLADLYNHEANEIENYFKLFNLLRTDLASKGNKLVLDAEVQISPTEKLEAGEIGSSEAVKKIFFKDNKLRSIDLIKKTLNATNTTKADKPSMTVADEDKYIEELKASLPAEQLEKFIGFLINRYATTELMTKIENKINAAKSEGHNFKDITTTASKYTFADFDNILKSSAVKILNKFKTLSGENIVNIIVGLLKID